MFGVLTTTFTFKIQFDYDFITQANNRDYLDTSKYIFFFKISYRNHVTGVTSSKTVAKNVPVDCSLLVADMDCTLVSVASN